MPDLREALIEIAGHMGVPLSEQNSDGFLSAVSEEVRLTFARLTRERDEARAALRPFTKLFDDTLKVLDFSPYLAADATLLLATVTVGDLRRAKAALPDLPTEENASDA